MRDEGDTSDDDKDTDDEVDDEEDKSVDIQYLKPSPTLINTRLDPTFLDDPNLETEYYMERIEPFIYISMVGTLKYWCKDSGSLNFLHTSWFYQWGFRKVFLHALESAFIRLPYHRLPHNVDRTNIPLHTPVAPRTLIKLNTTMTWGVSLDGFGTGFFSDHNGDPLTTVFYRGSMLALPQRMFDLLQQRFIGWPWSTKYKRDVRLALIPPTVETSSPDSWLCNFDSIQLVDTLVDATPVTKFTLIRKGAKVLDLVGIQHFTGTPSDPSLDITCPVTGRPPPVIPTCTTAPPVTTLETLPTMITSAAPIHLAPILQPLLDMIPVPTVEQLQARIVSLEQQLDSLYQQSQQQREINELLAQRILNLEIRDTNRGHDLDTSLISSTFGDIMGRSP